MKKESTEQFGKRWFKIGFVTNASNPKEFKNWEEAWEVMQKHDPTWKQALKLKHYKVSTVLNTGS